MSQTIIKVKIDPWRMATLKHKSQEITTIIAKSQEHLPQFKNVHLTALSDEEVSKIGHFFILGSRDQYVIDIDREGIKLLRGKYNEVKFN